MSHGPPWPTRRVSQQATPVHGDFASAHGQSCSRGLALDLLPARSASESNDYQPEGRVLMPRFWGQGLILETPRSLLMAESVFQLAIS